MNPQDRKLLEGFVRNPGTTTETINAGIRTLGLSLPEDYLEVLRHMNGGEGFVGQSYLRLYPIEKLLPLNQAYGVNEFAPGLAIFGSNGGGDAFAFNTHDTPPTIVRIPFIPMDIQYAEEYPASFSDFLTLLAQEGDEEPDHETQTTDESLIGKEIHEIHPVVFGGDPTDVNNKSFLTPEEYAPFVVWWNHKYRELINQE